MGFFSNLFGGGNINLDENIPIDSVTIDRQKKIQQARGSGKENVNITQAKKKNRRKGWGLNNKKKNKQRDTPQAAPKLSIFLQQIDPEDDHSLNQTVDTGSLTASITTNSISKSGSTSRPQTPVQYVRPLTAPKYTRPASAAGVSPPPLHESFPIDNVSENRSQSSNSTPEATQSVNEHGNETVQLLPQESLPRKHSHIDRNVTDTTASLGSSDVSSSDSSSSVMEELENFRVRKSVPKGMSTEDGHGGKSDDTSAMASSVGSEDAVEDVSGSYDEDGDGANMGLDFALMLDLDDNSLTDVEDILSPTLRIEFDATTLEQDISSIANSDHALENYSITSDSANEDLQGSFYLDIEENEALSFPVQMVFECDFLTSQKSKGQDSIQELDLSLDLDLNMKGEEGEEKTPETDVLKSFDDIVNEVEETIVNAQLAAQRKKVEESLWIANGLLASLRDDSSHSSSQNSLNSSFSFTSDDFKEEDFEEIEENTPVQAVAALGITTIVEEEKEDESTKDDSMDPIIEESGLGMTTIVEGEKEDESSNFASMDPVEEAEEEDGDNSELRRSNCDEGQVEELRHAISQMMEKQPITSASPTSVVEIPENSEPEEPSEPLHSTVSPAIPSASPVDRNIPKTSSPPRSLNSSITTRSPPRTLNSSFTGRSIPQSVSLNNSITTATSGLSQSFTSKGLNTPRSALLCKSLPRPELKKSVSWKDETDVYTYLPRGAEELQKARDLVATYEKIMAALNVKRPSVESKGDEEGSSTSASVSVSSSTSSSDNDISERSASSLSSIESLISALSHASSHSSGSVKIVIDQIKTETERIVAESLGSIDDENDETEQARTEILENKWPEIVETNASSSSIESLLSALSKASLESSESMKMVVQKLKDEAERRVILSAQMESEIKEVLAKKAEKRSNYDDTSSQSSSTFSSLAQSDISRGSSTGTSDSVKALMKQLNNERSKQANVFKSRSDMFTLLHNDNQKEEARVKILDNDWVDSLDCGSSSSLSSLLSASPCSSTNSNESSESVQHMMRTLKSEKERHNRRRERIRGIKDFVESACCIRTSTNISDYF